MLTQEKIRDSSELGAYPRIASPAELFSALTEIKAVTICGKLTPDKQRQLQQLLPDKKLVFQHSLATARRNEVPRETLLSLTGLTARQTQRLFTGLYDADSLVCGILTPGLFTAQ